MKKQDKKKQKKKEVKGNLYWAPRLLSVMFILFLSLLSLDVFGNGYTFWETVMGLLIHNIPSFVLIILLVVSWKHELVGGITFILAGLLYAILVLNSALGCGFEWYYLSWIAQISGVSFVIGALWILSWRKKK